MFLMADRIYRERQRYIAGGLAVVAIGIGVWYWQEQQRLKGDRSQSVLLLSKQR